jgi:hypothetical protein
MNKQILISIIAAMTLFTLVSALYSGESTNFTASQMGMVYFTNVSITGNASMIIYSFDNQTVNLTIPGDYNAGLFNITFYGWSETKDEPVVVSHSSGSSGGCITRYICEDWGQCINGTQARNCVKDSSVYGKISNYCWAPKVNTTQACSIPVSSEIYTNSSSQTDNDIPTSESQTNQDTKTSMSGIVIGVIIIATVLIAGLVIFFFYWRSFSNSVKI